MLKKIKMLAALLLLVCLFLPLSQCTQQPRPTDIEQKAVIYEHYAARANGDNYWGYLFVVPFVLPMLMVLFNIKVKHEKLRYELLDVFCGVLVLTMVMLHALIGTLVLGGYIALVAALSYLLASLVESGSTIKDRMDKS